MAQFKEPWLESLHRQNLMRYNGWKELFKDDGWIILYHPELKYGNFPVYVIICEKHRMDWSCHSCDGPPDTLIKKMRTLQQMALYETGTH